MDHRMPMGNYGGMQMPQQPPPGGVPPHPQYQGQPRPDARPNRANINPTAVFNEILQTIDPNVTLEAEAASLINQMMVTYMNKIASYAIHGQDQSKPYHLSYDAAKMAINLLTSATTSPDNKASLQAQKQQLNSMGNPMQMNQMGNPMQTNQMQMQNQYGMQMQNQYGMPMQSNQYGMQMMQPPGQVNPKHAHRLDAVRKYKQQNENQ